MRKFPLLRNELLKSGWIPWAIAEQAYKQYVIEGHGGQSLERVAQRGGFCLFEIDMLLAKDYNPHHWPKDEEFIRSSGSMICELCGLFYYDHPYSPRYLSYSEGTPFLKRLCDGRLVKL